MWIKIGIIAYLTVAVFWAWIESISIYESKEPKIYQAVFAFFFWPIRFVWFGYQYIRFLIETNKAD